MSLLSAELGLALLIILFAAQLFTNALEHLGKQLHLSAGVVGSLFAAVATALPETTVPVMAILAGGHNQQVNEQVSVGAILGAPLMLSTLSIFLMTLAVLKSRGIKGRIVPEKKGICRDLNFFILVFLLASSAMYIPQTFSFLRAIICCLLIGFYVGYIILTFKASKELVNNGHGVAPGVPLYFAKMGLPENQFGIIIQLIIGVGLLLIGAKIFIHGVEILATSLQISALLISLLIIPIATELPEKVNSIIWVRQAKDTLAMGNLTGAMVFQGALLPVLGIWLTPWQPSKEVFTGLLITLLAAIWLRLNLSGQGIRILALLLHGILYFSYIWLMLS